jgi:hypothetical protein
MIRHVAFLSTPMKPGEVRDLAVWADEPNTIAIKCYLWTPPPPGFKECDTCGSFTVPNAVAVKIVASQLFMNNPGQLKITVSDSTGDTKSFDIDVVP